eukprot:4969665-Pyramimonas_sp.AAC.1
MARVDNGEDGQTTARKAPRADGIWLGWAPAGASGGSERGAVPLGHPPGVPPRTPERAAPCWTINRPPPTLTCHLRSPHEV